MKTSNTTINQHLKPNPETSSTNVKGFDYHFAEYLNSIAKNPSKELFNAASLTVNLLSEGHIRLDLSKYAGTVYTSDEATTPVTLPELDVWIEKLHNSGVVGAPGDYYPLILENHYCYLYRYWKYQQDCASSIQTMQCAISEGFSSQEIECTLGHFFSDDQKESFQYSAAIAALKNSFTIITGGPGTGKTTTVAKIVAAYLLLTVNKHKRIVLAAPTGKAASRLADSLSTMRVSLQLPQDISSKFPSETYTLHRLLGTITGSVEFRYNEHTPLPYDLVIIDEASMIDIALMTKLLRAVPRGCQLILVGDKDQLSSVEAGSVFGDICNAGIDLQPQFADTESSTSLQTGLIDNKSRYTSLSTSVKILDKSYRFSEYSGIGELSKLVNAGDCLKSLELLRSSAHCTLKNISSANILKKALEELVMSHYIGICKEKDPVQALSSINNVRILCALRQGVWGAQSINRMISSICTINGIYTNRDRIHNGLPAMIKANDYRQNLFNGDTGIIIDHQGAYSAFFRNPDSSLRQLNLKNLPEWEPAFAITVHKSQGSEFTKTILILPPEESPLLTRELLYTAITRSKASIEIWCNEPVLKNSIERIIEKSTGLYDLLVKK